jgi:hypothetical protein
MSPSYLCALAAERGIEVMALTDHNSSMNCPAFAVTARRNGIVPLFGMEATVAEELHVLCLFANLEAAMDFGSFAYSKIMPFPNDPEKTGDQVYVDADDNIEGELEYFLPSALSISLDEISPLVAEYGGFVIPAHVDRSAFSMASQLGAVVDGPKAAPWAALECVRIPPKMPPMAGMPLPEKPLPLDTLGYHLTTSSDAHYPEDVGRRSFALDITREELLPNGPDRDADQAALLKAIQKRPVG